VDVSLATPFDFGADPDQDPDPDPGMFLPLRNGGGAVVRILRDQPP